MVFPLTGVEAETQGREQLAQHHSENPGPWPRQPRPGRRWEAWGGLRCPCSSFLGSRQLAGRLSSPARGLTGSGQVGARPFLVAGTLANPGLVESTQPQQDPVHLPLSWDFQFQRSWDGKGWAGPKESEMRQKGRVRRAGPQGPSPTAWGSWPACRMDCPVCGLL